MTTWVSLRDILFSLVNYRTMAAVGLDLNAVVRAAVRRDSVRKRGLRGSEFSLTPIDSLPSNAEVDIEGNRITVPIKFDLGWSQVEIAEVDFQAFLASAYDLAPDAPPEQYTPNDNPVAAKRARQPRGFNYATTDEALVNEGVEGVLDGTYDHATDAGLALAGKAAGHGKVESKATRLARQIKSKLREHERPD